jgi:hypothetical protein
MICRTRQLSHTRHIVLRFLHASPQSRPAVQASHEVSRSVLPQGGKTDEKSKTGEVIKKEKADLGVEYTAPRVAVKSEVDILKLSALTASLVAAHEGAKVGATTGIIISIIVIVLIEGHGWPVCTLEPLVRATRPMSV